MGLVFWFGSLGFAWLALQGACYLLRCCSAADLRNGASTFAARVREVLGNIVVVGVCLWGFV